MVIMKSKKIKKHTKLQKFSKFTTAKDVTNVESEREVVSKDIRIIAQEVQIVRSLACNDLNKRNRQIRKLRKWLQLRSRSTFPITEENFLRIWKGLYYNMWMSDKPLVQEELAEELGKLTECFDGDVSTSVNFFGAFMKTMCNEWFGMDQWRIDKFMMLVRRMLRYMFRVLKRKGWSKDAIQLFNKHMKLTVLADHSPATGLTMHYLDIFLEELAKVADGDISAERVGDFVRPFVIYLAMGRDPKLVSHCRTRVLQHLLYQSELGREYSEKFNAWKEMGFPTASIGDLEKVVENDEEDIDIKKDNEDVLAVQSTEKHLDPRAGDVDVLMPELPLDAKYVIEELEMLLYKNDGITTKIRKSLRKQLNIFHIYQQGEFPLGVKQMPRFTAKTDKPLMREKIEKLENVENELFGVGRKLKQLNKRKRRKFLNSINFAEVDESNYDQTIMKALPQNYLKERKRKSSDIMNEWIEEELTLKDLSPKKKQKKEKVIKKSEEVSGISGLENKSKQEGKLRNIECSEVSSQPKNLRGKEQSNELKANSSTDSKVSTVEKLEDLSIKVGHLNTKQKDGDLKKVGIGFQTERSTDDEQHHLIKSKNRYDSKVSSVEHKTTKTPDVPTNKVKSVWDLPLAEGEIEYFIPSRKIQLKNATAGIVPNPLAHKASTPTNVKKIGNTLATPNTNSAKRVKIALKRNTSQNPSEYIRQIKSSPNLPYDATKKPGKGLLKPNSVPSPINPFYKKKIGLKIANDTI